MPPEFPFHRRVAGKESTWMRQGFRRDGVIEATMPNASLCHEAGTYEDLRYTHRITEVTGCEAPDSLFHPTCKSWIEAMTS